MFEHMTIDFQEIIRREKAPLEQEIQELRRKEQELRRKEQELRRKEQELRRKEQETAQVNLRTLGLSDEQITQALGL